MLPRLLELSIKIAIANDYYPKWKHGCVITRGGRVLSVGQNKWRNGEAASIHAECDALSRCKDSIGAILYVARVGKNGDPRLSKPCQRCKDMIESRGIKRVIFSIDSESYGVLKL